MSSFKVLKKNCQHANGYRNNDNKCPDCGSTAAPSVQIEHVHQMLLKAWIQEQGGQQNGESVNVPMNIMLATRLAAVETVLDKQHRMAEETSPIVSLQ